ncbi:hypothetical protein K458DRAFT_490729 [Lentithecium fluviatile CBS 122367]|uniref:Uncharacterized protein n=1 Tax=Lentithecium fluviatile CBS 122367 TaxID=1168545 RepID=A0A6G1ILX7_9PLEO|nr:hypothetical protein K458DRAFT_490729 [Lentithecium fluviatile CBS 122367]
MPAAAKRDHITVKPRWPAVPYPMINGTAEGTTTTSKATLPEEIKQTPSIIPEPVYETVSVVPASDLPPSPTHAPVPQYIGSTAKLLQGYCTEPAYTILDGPTAIWMPVVGCISSRTDCCPTPTTDGGAADPTRTGQSGGSGGGGSGGGGSGGGGSGGSGVAGGAQFPRSMLPSQGALTGCPQDYHTVGGTACCPSSYWLWSTSLGGQIPCYSSLAKNLDAPPIPDTLVDGGRLTTATITGSDGVGTPTTTIPKLTMSQKPTLAILNIAYSMQYPLVEEPKPALSKPAKIGVGVGGSLAGVALVALLWFVIRKFLAHKRTKGELSAARQTNMEERFGSSVPDRSRVAHHGGKAYTGVATTAVNY